MNKRLYFIGLVLIGLSLAYGLYYYDQLPEQMAVHFLLTTRRTVFRENYQRYGGCRYFLQPSRPWSFFSPAE